MELMLKISRAYSIDKPYIVGGIVRNNLLKHLDKENDLDVTTNSQECLRLGILFAAQSNSIFRMFEDRHIRVFYSQKNIDYSPGVLSFAHSGVSQWVSSNAPGKEKYIESYSRDFTINTLFQDFESGQIYDPTDLGLGDIESRIIRTPAPPEITIKNDPRRIFRAIKFASQFNMSIDSSIVDYVRSNSEIILDQKLTTKYMTNEINFALKYNPDLAISNIFDLGLFKIIPLSGLYSEYLIKNKMLSKYLS
jgi:tRNA nucleotidyltransferase/poly(A) polymerase